MERQKLWKIADIEDEAVKIVYLGAYKIEMLTDPDEEPEFVGLNSWLKLKGSDHDGIYRFYNEATDEDYGILLSDWRYNEDYYFIVCDNHKSSGAEVELKDEAGEELCWLYRPSKRDGRNLERKEAFKKIYGDLKVYFQVPQNVEELAKFIRELLELAANRKKADNFGA